MDIEMNKTYSPSEWEDKIYKDWQDSGYFNPDNLPLAEDAPTYTIVLPPPNITDKLHMGHGAMIAIEDLLIRYRRMNGYRTLWIPGTDHAAIATQNVVEKKLLKESGQTRHDLGRERFLAEVWKFLNETQATILLQTKKMGASMDWSRLAFTLDKPRQAAVKKMFCDMHEAGAIYRGERIVNWCPRCHSTLADDEVEYKEEPSKLYWIKYGPFVLATSRPETKLGDTAVAVHPDDPRYQEYIGKELEIKGVLGKFMVTVVADRAVDMTFGSGAIKVTPAHSFVDNEIAQRHNLPSRKIIDEDGKMMDNCGKYAGLKVAEAREQIVADMRAMGLIDHIDEDYVHNGAFCYRCGSVIEPLPSRQWFVAVDKPLDRFQGKSLKQVAKEAALAGEIKFVPNRFHKRYVDWMENLHDWCISRQIWFGHRIPVWYRGEETYVGEQDPPGAGWVQDEDTLDTWFSSGMWTFSTLGWPENFQGGKKIGDLAKFHPTQVLETGYEIITLWVSRMIMMSLFAIGEIPFHDVYLHGMILDKDGKKMSKSKGNGTNPLDVIEHYGADAARLSLLMGATPGNDTRYSQEKVEAKRNFINKLWNVSRFMISQGADIKSGSKLPEPKSAADRWILHSLAQAAVSTYELLDSYEFSLAAETLTDFTWNKLADWYLEVSKFEPEGKAEMFSFILRQTLMLWHPFIPFVTEAIWRQGSDEPLLISQWFGKEGFASILAELASAPQDFLPVSALITSIRNARSEHGIEPGKKLSAKLITTSPVVAANLALIRSLKTGLSEIEIIKKEEEIADAITIVSGGDIIYLLGAVDSAKEKDRLAKEQTRLSSLVTSLKGRLANQEFIDRAPAHIVEQERQKLVKLELELENITKQL